MPPRSKRTHSSGASATEQTAGAPAAAATPRDKARPPSGELVLSRAARITPHLRLTIQMVLAARRWRAILDDHLRPLGHSAARMEALSTIAHSPPNSAQIEIAKRIGVEGATFTRMLDSLEADGLVERVRDPADRRTKRIRVTPAGHAALTEILTVTNELRARLLEGLDDPALDQANRFLGLLLARLDSGLSLPAERARASGTASWPDE